MTKNELMVIIAAILTTLAETNGSPESMLYITCGMDMSKWETVKSVLLQCKFVKISGHYVTLTEFGKETASKLNAVIAK